MYFDYPLEQGLRLSAVSPASVIAEKYFDYPLEQGLRQEIAVGSNRHRFSILIIH